MQLATAGSDSYEKDVQSIISKIIKKSVQVEYSGAGRKVKGEGKRSFRDTQTYQCMTGKFSVYLYISLFKGHPPERPVLYDQKDRGQLILRFFQLFFFLLSILYKIISSV